MRRNTLLAVVVGLFLVSTLAGVAITQDEEPQSVRGQADLNVYTPEPTLTPGTTSEFTLQIENDGEILSGATAQREMVTTARAVTLDVRDSGPIDVETDRHSIGSIADGDVREIPITVTVPEDAEPGEYSLDVRLRYSYTFQYTPRSNYVQERTRTRTESIDLTVDDGPRFDIETLESDVQIGGSGTVRTEVTNVGGEPARDLTVGMESSSPDVTFGEATGNTARIERLGPGENATLTYDVHVRSDVSLRNVTLTGDVQYADADGVQHTQDGLSTGLSPSPEQAFSLAVDESTLRVGESGIVRGTIRNDGPADVTDVVLVVGETQFEVRSPTYSIGDLDEGGSETFQFRGTIPPGGDAVPQRIDIETRYRTGTNTDRVSRESIHVPVAERRDSVSISALDPQFAAGEDGVLELDVTNRRDVEIRDVRLRLNAAEPLESEFPSTVIQSLRPGESETIAFDLEVDGDAPPSRYPAVVETEYTDPDDEQVTVGPATVAVTVTEAEGIEYVSIEMLVFVILLVLVGAVFVWLYRK